MGDFRHLFATLQRVLGKRGRSGDEVNEVVQEAFLRLQVCCRDQTVENTEAFLDRTAINLSAERGRTGMRRWTRFRCTAPMARA